MRAVSYANLHHPHLIMLTNLVTSTNYKARHYVICSTRRPCSVYVHVVTNRSAAQQVSLRAVVNIPPGPHPLTSNTLQS